MEEVETFVRAHIYERVWFEGEGVKPGFMFMPEYWSNNRVIGRQPLSALKLLLSMYLLIISL
jgi:hypothetical protein